MKIAEVHTTGGNEPVPLLLRVDGPTSGFRIMNLTKGMDGLCQQYFIYDASLPGAREIPAGHFAEIDCGRGTIRLNGTYNNEADLIAGVSPDSFGFLGERIPWLTLRLNCENRLMWGDAKVTVLTT